MGVDSGTQFAQLLMRALEVMVDEVSVELEDAGHPGLTVANELAMHAIGNGATNAASLARATGVSRQAAAKTIGALEALGYVVREADAGDARKKNLTVTPRGHSAIGIGARAFDRIFIRWRQRTGAASGEAVRALEQLIAGADQLIGGTVDISAVAGASPLSAGSGTR